MQQLQNLDTIDRSIPNLQAKQLIYSKIWCIISYR